MPIEFLITIVFILIHISTSYLKVLDKIPRSRFLSISGGVAVSYVFIHILPILGQNQAAIEGLLENNFLKSIENHIYVIALLGLVIFYGLERMSKASKEKNEKINRSSKGVFWIHLFSTSIYNAVTGYLLVHRRNDSVISLLLFGIAIGLHFFVVDHGLRVYYKEAYDKYGRWTLSFGSLIGFIIGYTTKINELFVSILFAFLAGGIILNILKEELPEERRSSFISFFLGALVYSALLLLSQNVI